VGDCCAREIRCAQSFEDAWEQLQRLQRRRHQSGPTASCCLMTTVWSPMFPTSPLATVDARPSRGGDQRATAFQFHARRETNDSTTRRVPPGSPCWVSRSRRPSVRDRARPALQTPRSDARRTAAPEGRRIQRRRAGPTRPGITLTGRQRHAVAS